MSIHRTFAAAALLALSACADNPAAGGGGDNTVRLRFGVAGGQALASAGRFQTSGTEQLTITGANGTLRIDDLRMVMAEFELDGDDDVNRCSDDAGAADDCEDFNAGPMFIDFPLTGGPVPVSSGNVPAGTYEEVEFEVEDLDDDEENPAERARIEQLRAQILAQFPDWPRGASLLVVGTFTPTGGAPQSFRAFVEAEIEIETELSPRLVVGVGESRSVDVLLDPAILFRNGNNVLNLAQSSARDELEIRIENGFRGRGGSDD
ncbi:hypothetical protein [Longimicrobium sp.]|uniref:hypothetical protein n=1 Tax=Longimicrobium sp. TaxID=2029185 RepID=UPI003B3BBB05